MSERCKTSSVYMVFNQWKMEVSHHHYPGCGQRQVYGY